MALRSLQISRDTSLRTAGDGAPQQLLRHGRTSGSARFAHSPLVCRSSRTLDVVGAVSDHELAYVVWQNRAFRFYLGTRSLHRSKLYAPAAYTAAMAIELILKATLVFWDREFLPTEGGHGVAKLARMVKNKARGNPSFEVPEYFYYEQRYLTTTRYPTNGKGVLLPNSFIDDLDQVFADVLLLVPFQQNTELRSSLSGRTRGSLLHLRRNNRQMRRLRAALGVKLENWGQTPIKFDKMSPKELALARKRMKEWENVDA